MMSWNICLDRVGSQVTARLLIGTGQVSRMAKIQMIESALVAGIAYLALRYGSMELMLLAMASVMLSITGWMLPRRVAVMLRK